MIFKKTKSADGEARLNRSRLWSRMKYYRFLYFMLAAAIIYTFIFSYLPMLGTIMAFQDYNVKLGFTGSEFVGFDNFIKVLTLPKFVGAIKNTLIYSSVSLFLGLPFPIIFALLLNELNNLKFKKVVQTMSYMPHFLSWISVIGIFYTIFANDGFYNDLMVKIVGETWERKNILMDHENFLGIIFWSARWKELGWNAIVYIAAIAGIDQSMYEAATVDGCGKFKQVLYITLPSILPTVLILLIMSMGSLVQTNFTQIYGFQNIFTQEYTETINTIAYRQGIQGGQYSLTTALGIMQGAISLLLVVTSNWISKKVSGSGLW